MQAVQLLNEKSYLRYSTSIANKIDNGFVIVERDDSLPFAVLFKKGKKVNHMMNLLLTILTLGVWSIVWLYSIFVLSKPRKILIAIDEDGNLYEDDCYLEQ